MSLPAADNASNWPQFRGPGGLGVSKEAAPTKWSRTENIVWKTELLGGGNSSPVIFGDHIYLGCYTGFNVPGQRGGEMNKLVRHAVCLDRSNGKVLWSKEVPTRLPEQTRIRDDHGYTTNTPAADRDGVVFFFGKSGVFAFDHEGRERWRADVGDRIHGWGSATSPVLFEELVFINASVESGTLVALNRKTGKEVWKATGIRESWSTPLLVSRAGGETDLVLSMQGKVLAFDPRSGEQLWSCATDIGWYMVPGLVAKDGVVYCLGGRSGIASLAVKTGGEGDVTRTHRLWTSLKGSNVSSPVIHGEHLYWVNDSQGVAYCAEAATGKVQYEQRLPRAGQFYSSPVLADGKLFYTSRDGKTFVIAAKPAFEQLAVNDLSQRGETFNSSPAVVDGRLLLRSDRFLYCIGEK